MSDTSSNGNKNPRQPLERSDEAQSEFTGEISEGEEVVVVDFMSRHDLLDVAQLDAECFTSHWSIQSYQNELNNPASCYIVARRNTQVIGFGGMWMAADEAHITMLGVRAYYRRRGLGSVLLAILLQIARRAGATRATLEVRESNIAAIELYRKFGFTDVGARPRYYETEDARIMWAHDLNAIRMCLRIYETLDGYHLRHLTVRFAKRLQDEWLWPSF